MTSQSSQSLKQYKVKRAFTDRKGQSHTVGEQISGTQADMQQHIDAGDVETAQEGERSGGQPR